MTDPAIYREYARQCVEVAQSIASPEQRAAMWEMARVWHQLAMEREALNASETEDDVPSAGSG